MSTLKKESLSAAIESIPFDFRSSLDQTLKILFENVQGLKAIALVGSVPQGDDTPESDLDLLFVTKQNPDYELLMLLEYMMECTEKHVQLIWYSEDMFERQFIYRTTMAYSLKSGLTLYDPYLIVNKCCSKLSGLPSLAWMRNWFNKFDGIYLFERGLSKDYWRFHQQFCRKDCVCMISNAMARVVVNMAILFLESKGIIPTTKKQILKGIKSVVPELNPVIELSLRVRKRDRFLTWGEYCLASRTARYLRKELLKFFGCRVLQNRTDPLKLDT